MRHLLVFALLSFVVTTAQSAAPPRVRVSFSLDVPAYTREFRSEDLPAITAAAAKKVSEKLQESVKFLVFDTQAITDYALQVTLQVSPRTSTLPLKQTLLRVELHSAGQRLAEYEHEFRPPRDYDKKIAPAQTFLDEIGVSFDRLNWGALHSEILSRIPIASTARSWTSPPGWFLESYRRTDLCLERGTALAVSSDLLVGNAVLPLPFDGLLGDLNPPAKHELARYRGHIFLSADEVPAQRRSQVRSNLDSLRVRAVYIRTPKPMVACTVSTSQ